MLPNLVITTILTLFLSAMIPVKGQPYLLPNETTVFSFITDNGKKAALTKDKKDKYLIYRFGTKNKIDFQYSDTAKSSWQLFRYSFWLRGGGIKNEGIDLNYLAFINNGFKYVIYSTCFAVKHKTSVGIKVLNLKTGKTTDIKGDIKTQQGTLTDFRNSVLVGTDDELYD